MRLPTAMAVAALLGGLTIVTSGSVQSSSGVSSLERLKQEVDTLDVQLSEIGEREEALSERVERLAHEIERLEAELDVEHTILKQYRLAGYLRQSRQAIVELEAVRGERLKVSQELRELKERLIVGLRERRRELVEVMGRVEGEDFKKNLYDVAMMTLELESLQEEAEEEAGRRRARIEVHATDSPIELREKAEIIKRAAAEAQEMVVAVDRRIEQLREEELVREKLAELKEEVAWLDEEAVPSRRVGERDYYFGDELSGPDYREGEAVTIRGMPPTGMLEAFWGARGAARIAEIQRDREELERKSTSLLHRADSLETMVDRLLKMAEEMEELREKQP